jgi:hypothetical protein
MDLNRQALLALAIAVLGPAAAAHAARPRALAAAIREHGVLPGARARSWAPAAYAALVAAGELAAVGVAVASAFASTTRVAGVLLAGAGASFVAYVARLLARGYRGDCGCSPVAATVTRLSLVPGAALLAAGAVLVADRPLGEAALARGSGPLETGMALGAAALVGALLSLLPASALVGDPLSLGPEG